MKRSEAQATGRACDLSDESLVCPICARVHPPSERFCSRCAVPLVYAKAKRDAERPLGERELWARKVKPQFTEGALVKVVGARNQTEAEFIQGLLLEEGIPSMLRRSRGFDVPDFLAAGPRDVMVSESGAVAAREVLLQSEIIPAQGPDASGIDAAWRVMAWLLVAVAVVAIVVWLRL